MSLRRLLSVSALVFSVSAAASADVITQFGVGGLNKPLINAELIALGIPPNAGSETTATSFTVPGVGPATLTFHFRQDFGAFLFNFGFFDLSGVSADPTTQKETWAVQALTGSTVVFDDTTQNPGASKTVVVPGGTNLGFFIVPDNSVANYLANPGLFTSPPGPNAFRAPLFSVSDANPGEFDQMLSFLGGGKTMFAFEDLTRTGVTDDSFTDLVFSIDVQLSPTEVPEPGSLVLLAGGLLGLLARARRRS